MQKIPTIFDRDWEGNRAVINKVVQELPMGAVATEKLDGTNVRLTVRNHTLIRLEKRRNPTKLQKAKGIVDPWYVDADEYAPEDKHIWEAARATDISDIPDGEWSGEALGEKIEGNPLHLSGHTVFLFSYMWHRVAFQDAPTDYEGLKEWLPKQLSKFGNNCNIEGLVWWNQQEPIGKIKVKDFKADTR